jgi:hypothetical protein
MLSEQERLKKWESFRDGPDFGKHTWMTLQLYNINIGYLIRAAELYWIVIKRLESGDFEGTHSDSALLRIEQLVALDSISRIQSGIEVTLVLIHELSNGYSGVAQCLTYYPTQLPRQVAENVLAKKYNLQKIFGLPNISSLGLDPNEWKVIAKLYEESTETLQKMLETLASFYDRYRIIYGKSKHGLTIQSGGGMNTEQTTPNFSESLLFVLDRKEKDDMPKGSVNMKISDPLIQVWFNAQSMIKFGETLENDISAALKTLEEVSRYLSCNHMTYAQNCGEPYLPVYEKESNAFTPWFYGSSQLDLDESQLIDSAVRKIMPDMNIIRTNLFIRRDIRDQRLLSMMLTDPVVNMWFE